MTVVTATEDIAGDTVVVVDVAAVVDTHHGVGDEGVFGPVVAVGDADTRTSAAGAINAAIEVFRLIGGIFDDTDEAAVDVDPGAAGTVGKFMAVAVAHIGILTHRSQRAATIDIMVDMAAGDDDMRGVLDPSGSLGGMVIGIEVDTAPTAVDITHIGVDPC